MSPYSPDFLRRHYTFNYNGYYSSLSYECLVFNSELSTCLWFTLNYNLVVCGMPNLIELSYSLAYKEPFSI